MSATRDKNQRVSFVYSNLYQIYRKGKEAAQNAELPAEPASHAAPATPVSSNSATPVAGLTRSSVLKSDDLHSQTFGAVKVDRYEPTEFLQKRIERAAAPTVSSAPAAAPIPLKPVSLGLAPRPAVISPPSAHNETLKSLKQNMQALNDLHSRLRFMLQELEDLVKED